jgi:hypothetical protein
MNDNFLIEREEKRKYCVDNIFMKDNVYFTFAPLFILNNKTYSIDDKDGSLIINSDKLIEAINNYVIINLKYTNYIIAVVIPKTFESKLKEAIELEYYELASILLKQINSKCN